MSLPTSPEEPVPESPAAPSAPAAEAQAVSTSSAARELPAGDDIFDASAPAPVPARADAGAEVASTVEVSSTEVASTVEVASEAQGLAAAPVVPDLSPAACAVQLAERFPAVFSPGAPKPLKLRIQADIQQRAPGIFTRKSLSTFLHRHTTGTGYLRSMVSAPHRTDLDGQPAGEVADEHRQAASAELDRRRALHEERRAAEREAQRKLRDEQRLAYQAQRQAGDQAVTAAALPNEAQPPVPDSSGATPGRPKPHNDPRRPRDAGRPPRQDARPPGPGGPGGPGARHAVEGQQRHGDKSRRRPQDAQHRPLPAERSHEQQGLAERPPRGEHQNAAPDMPSEPVVVDEGRRERAALLRAYESSTLTKANFCVLKRLTEAQLDAVLAQARLDAPMPAARPADRGQRPDDRGAQRDARAGHRDQRAGGRTEGRGPRPAPSRPQR